MPNSGKIATILGNVLTDSQIDLSTKADLVDGKIPSTQLPSYVDDILEYANLAAFPATGSSGIIYVAQDTNKIYRWTGSAYAEVSPTVGTTWGTITGTLSNQTDLQTALDAKVPTSRTLTIQGVAQTLSADRTWNIYTIYGISLGNATMNQSYGSTHILRNENGLGAAVTYSPCLHAAAGDTMWQLQGTYGATGDGYLYFRQGYNGAWGNWLTMLSSSNYSSYAVPLTRTITINGTALDLSANRSWSVGNVTGSGVTNRIAYWDSASSIGYLDTASYPSLTELGYVKGVTSAIQTQLDGKQAALSSPLAYGGAYSTPNYTGATYDGITTGGYYRLNGGGDSRGVLVFDVGGSVGTTQIETSYNLGLRFRNKTDNNTWNAFKLILTDANYSGYALPLSGGSISGPIYINSASGNPAAFLQFMESATSASSRRWKVSNDQVDWGDFVIQNSATQTGTPNQNVLQLRSDRSAYFWGTVTSASNVSSPTFSNETGYPYNTLFGAGADASTSTLRAGSTNGYQSAIYVRGGTASSGNQISFHTASAERVNISNSTFGIYIDTIATKYLRVDGEDGAKVYDITRGFDTGANDEYWIRIYLQQFYYQQNSNDGRIEIDIQWNPIHASFHAYTKLEFNYHSTYWRSPSYVYFSQLKKTIVGDFGGGTYYGASSTPQVDLYDKNDGYLYIRVKGNTTSNNLNQRKTLRMQLVGKVGYEPTIEVGVSAPTGGSFVDSSYVLDQQNGNLTVSNAFNSAYSNITATTTRTYTPTAYNDYATLTLSSNGTNANGGDNHYSGIRFSNRNGSREQFFGVVQVASNRGDYVWQNYTGSQYQEGMRLYGGNHTLEVRGDVIAYGSPSDIRLKTIKEKVPNALESVLKLNGYRFDWDRPTVTSDIKEDIGVVAQEVEQLFPELARTNEDGYMSVRYQGLTAVLIEAVKELAAENNKLKEILERNNIQ